MRMMTFAMAAAAPWLSELFVPLTPSMQLERTPQLFYGILECCLAIAFGSLWLAARDFRVFRTLGIFYFVVAVEQFFQYAGADKTIWEFRVFAVILLAEAAGEAMQIERRRWVRVVWPVYFFSLIAGWFPGMEFTRDWPVLFSEATLIVLIVQGFRRGSRLIAAAFLVHCLVRMTISTNVQHWLGVSNTIRIGGWRYQYTTTTLTVLGFVTLFIFVRALMKDREDKQRLAAELEAGRAMQQMLIPSEVPAVLSFRIEAVYRPHGKVGGDFFQVIPLADGGALIAIGDVSGKGTPAAIMVSLLVGALHAQAETTASPAQLLTGLNRCAMGRSCGGFTTCLILRMDADGTLTAANAGHLAPYIDGCEATVENGLPLGITESARYAESSFALGAGARITLLTDGVVEARSKSGELFGFPRTEALSGDTADEIASAAQQFGQEDDITVLTVARAG